MKNSKLKHPDGTNMVVYVARKYSGEGKPLVMQAYTPQQHADKLASGQLAREIKIGFGVGVRYAKHCYHDEDFQDFLRDDENVVRPTEDWPDFGYDEETRLTLVVE